MDNRKLMTTLIVLIVAMAAYGLLTMPDRRTASERISDAARQLEDRTPGQKIGDAVKDTGDDIKRDTAPATQ